MLNLKWRIFSDYTTLIRQVKLFLLLWKLQQDGQLKEMWIVKENYVVDTVNDWDCLLSKRVHIEHNNDHKSICRTKLSRYMYNTTENRTKTHCYWNVMCMKYTVRSWNVLSNQLHQFKSWFETFSSPTNCKVAFHSHFQAFSAVK